MVEEKFRVCDLFRLEHASNSIWTAFHACGSELVTILTSFRAFALQECIYVYSCAMVVCAIEAS